MTVAASLESISKEKPPGDVVETLCLLHEDATQSVKSEVNIIKTSFMRRRIMNTMTFFLPARQPSPKIRNVRTRAILREGANLHLALEGSGNVAKGSVVGGLRVIIRSSASLQATGP